MHMDLWYELALRDMLDLDQPATELRMAAEELALPTVELADEAKVE